MHYVVLMAHLRGVLYSPHAYSMIPVKYIVTSVNNNSVFHVYFVVIHMNIYYYYINFIKYSINHPFRQKYLLLQHVYDLNAMIAHLIYG